MPHIGIRLSGSNVSLSVLLFFSLPFLGGWGGGEGLVIRACLDPQGLIVVNWICWAYPLGFHPIGCICSHTYMTRQKFGHTFPFNAFSFVPVSLYIVRYRQRLQSYQWASTALSSKQNMREMTSTFHSNVFRFLKHAYSLKKHIYSYSTVVLIAM